MTKSLSNTDGNFSRRPRPKGAAGGSDVRGTEGWDEGPVEGRSSDAGDGLDAEPKFCELEGVDGCEEFCEGEFVVLGPEEEVVGQMWEVGWWAVREGEGPIGPSVGMWICGDGCNMRGVVGESVEGELGVFNGESVGELVGVA